MASCTYLAYVLGLMLFLGDVNGRSLSVKVEDKEKEEVEKESAVPCSTDVKYSIVHSCDWSPEKFPTDYPEGDAHWSPLCGATHNSSAVLWRTGEEATPGVQLVAETGECSILQEEIEACIGAEYCDQYLSYPCDEFSGTCDHVGEINMTNAKPYVSLVSMVAPSPDWFTGVRDVKLCGDDGYWVSKYERDLSPYDAGTDSGTTYRAADLATDPKEVIALIDTPDASNIFYNAEDMKQYPICKMTITLAQ